MDTQTISEHTDLLRRLGGPYQVAKMLRLPRANVYHWRNRGIAQSWRREVARLAEEAEEPLPDGFLDPPYPKGRRIPVEESEITAF